MEPISENDHDKQGGSVLADNVADNVAENVTENVAANVADNLDDTEDDIVADNVDDDAFLDQIAREAREKLQHQKV